MKYKQHNPLPIPARGASIQVQSAFATVFDWEYDLEKEKLLALYEKGKLETWNATELPWDTDVDMRRLYHDRRQAAGGQDVFNEVMKPPIKLDPDQVIEFQVNMNAWMLSQFLHGEQGALVATAKIVQSVADEEAKFYAANQVADEARHVEVYHRYLTEKLGRSFEINEDLEQLLIQTCSDSRWDITYLGMQIMVEGLALSAFSLIQLMVPDEPLIQEITHRIMADESRHVAFGVLALEDVYSSGQLTSQELREREDFIIDATHLMKERMLMKQVFERMDFDIETWMKWSETTPFQQAFRQMLFSKIVPNLKRIGLLTPRVRKVYDKLGLLRFEHGKDSSIEAGVVPPTEFLELLADLSARSEGGGLPC